MATSDMNPVEVITEVEEDEDESCMALDDPGFKTGKKVEKAHTFRQHSVTARAKHRWDQLKRAVDDRAQTKKDVTEKWVNLTRSMSHGVSEFFGVSSATTDVDKVKEKWHARSRRLHGNTLLGGTKDDVMDSSNFPSTRTFSYIGAPEDQFDSIGSPQLRWNRRTPHPIDPLSRAPSRQISHISTASSSRRALRAQPGRHTRKESVFKMTMDGIKHVAQGFSSSQKKSFVRSRSFAPSLRGSSAAVSVENFLDDVFFDTPAPTSAAIRTKPFFAPGPSVLPHIHERGESENQEPLTPLSDGVFNSLDTVDGMSGAEWLQKSEASLPEKPGLPDFGEPRIGPLGKPVKEEEEPGKEYSGMRRIKDILINATFVNSDRRQYGVGVVGVWLDRDYRKSRIDSGVKKQMEEMDDHRPFFTYWVTFVQIVIFLFTIIVYGVTEFGFELKHVIGEVQRINLAKESCDYREPQNMWFGPRQADLIHLGAKYSPCMRPDHNIEILLIEERKKEQRSSCCIMNDGSGCVQSVEEDCSRTLSTWNGTFRTVCHQDPLYCLDAPPIILPTGVGGWPDDFTLWPPCKSQAPKDNIPKSKRHMTCDILGRPCCVGIEGQCIITTQDHCQFLKGYFHEEAALCSQVSCLNEICGMIPFLKPSVPDQFYRLWTSLFLHAGLIQLLITVCFQMVVMRDLEKLAGWIRISVIYLMSGIAGSLSSAIFLPYHVEAGPAGSQFGLLACLFVEVIHSWHILRNPAWALGKLLIVLAILFVVGLFPWIDNYAHLIGFTIGFLLSFALFPHIDFNIMDSRGKKIGIAVCLIASIGLFIGLIILFYVSPIWNCQACKYFNCIPLTDTLCDSMEVKIEFKKY